MVLDDLASQNKSCMEVIELELSPKSALMIVCVSLFVFSPAPFALSQALQLRRDRMWRQVGASVKNQSSSISEAISQTN